MWNKLPYLLVVFLSVYINGQSLRTETIDGVNTFSSSNEKLATTNGTQLYGFVTWDKEYLYIAYSGNSPNGPVTDDNRVYHIYIDTDPQKTATSGTGTTASDAWAWNPTLPFSANYHYAFKTVDNTEYKKIYSGSAWTNTTLTTQNFKGSGYWEVKIKLSDLGSPKQINLISYVEEDWSGGNLNGGIPTNLFMNTTTQGAITFNNHFLNYYLNDQVNPNAAFNLDNYQWQIRLKVSSSGLIDSSAIAGMALNSTNDYDSGIDLPKPPSAPSNYLSLYFPHTDWSSALGPKYARDIKLYKSLDSTTSSWDVSIASDLVSQTLTVSALSFDFVPSSYGISLYDIAKDSTHNLRTSNYQFSSGSSSATHYFRLIVGNSLSSPNISANVTALSYGTLKTNKDSIQNVVITNIGDSALVVSNIISTHSFYTFTGSTTYTITKNNSVTIPVKFSPRAAGLFEGKLLVHCNDPDTDTLEVALSGTGVTLLPKISVSSSTLSYGSIKVAYDSSLTFKIYNTGDTTLTVSALTSSSGNFTANNSVPFSVNVKDSATVSVTFTPDEVKSINDSLSITNTDPTNSSLKVYLTGSGIESVLLKDFTAGWNLISIPVQPTDQSTSAVISDDVANFFFYEYKNAVYQTAITVERNKGYWFGIETNATVDVTGKPRITNDTISISAGWNLVGSPFLKKYPKSAVQYSKNGVTVSADSAVQLGWIQNSFYNYNVTSKSYESADTLSLWNGYWLAALTDGVKSIYLKNSQTGSVPKKATSNDANTNFWAVSISASLNGMNDNLLSFGQSDFATDAFDAKYDFVKPPKSPAASLETYFENANWISYFSKFASDIKKSSTSKDAQWSFNIAALQNGILTLDWKNILTQIPAEMQKQFAIISLSTNDIPDFQSVDMLKQFSLSLQAEKDKTYKFNINASITDVNDEDIQPKEFGLNQNYPNPFNPVTSIKYSVAFTQHVQLKVYDLIGDEIAVLVNETKSPGTYTVEFSSDKLASGTYFYRLQSGDFVQTKKMIILK
ncbi:MAG: choice-of-anchor D domain-containing protein [Ignavibacteriaceae bacterium]|nr:choice-of-anchor D domain-containing protein [Ignavibacteriaceae bacterium]